MMNTYVYILTDSNRTHLHIGLSDGSDNHCTHKNHMGFCPDDRSMCCRVVYHEWLPSAEMAVRRFQELSGYTRMQKEKLIRRHNPNWRDLSSSLASDLPAYISSPLTTVNYVTNRCDLW